MRKLNCWEVKRCGREPGGERVTELGTCPASVDERLNGMYGGVNAGRACWVVAGTMCGGEVRATFAQKIGDCEKCDFYALVKQEEGKDFLMTLSLLAKIQK